MATTQSKTTTVIEKVRMDLNSQEASVLLGFLFHLSSSNQNEAHTTLLDIRNSLCDVAIKSKRLDVEAIQEIPTSEPYLHVMNQPLGPGATLEVRGPVRTLLVDALK